MKTHKFTGLRGNNSNNTNNNNTKNNPGRPGPNGEVKKKCTIFNLHNLQTWALITVLIAIATGVGVAIFLALQKNVVAIADETPTEPREILFGNEYEDETSKA